MELFEALIQKDDAGRLTFFEIPFHARERFCKPKGTIYVSGTINGAKYCGKLLSRGGEKFLMVIDKGLQKSIGFDGQTMVAQITMSPQDLEPAGQKQEEPVAVIAYGWSDEEKELCHRWEPGKIHYDKW